MKLEVGQFVRYKNGIGKIVGKYVKGVLIDKGIAGYFRTENEDIVKASHNIIDLIEVGDYVNGVMVESMNNSIKPTPIPQYKNECDEYVDFDESDIKSIVTKEQFSAMEYRLGDK